MTFGIQERFRNKQAANRYFLAHYGFYMRSNYLMRRIRFPFHAHNLIRVSGINVATHLFVMSVKQPGPLMQSGSYHDVDQASVNIRHCAEFPRHGSVTDVDVPLYGQRQCQPDARRVEHVRNYLQRNMADTLDENMLFGLHTNISNYIMCL